MSKALLGIFDSGVGGFSVLREVRKETQADILYFGDCARAPYGNRQEEEIISFIKDIIEKLRDEGVTHFVSACNSMSVLTTQQLLHDMGIAVESYIDMTDAVDAITFPSDAKVVIVGTRATLRSGVYQSVLSRKDIIFDEMSPTTLAGDIEAMNQDSVRQSIKEVICYTKEKQGTHILYACTHYPLVHDIFLDVAEELDVQVDFIDPAQLIADKVKCWNLKGESSTKCLTSKETSTFSRYRATLC